MTLGCSPSAMRATSEREPEAKVLVVEDDDANREAMVEILARAGYRVLAAATGAEAVELARAHEPDLVVLDVVLPDAGGAGVAREVRRDDPLRDVPVLYVTGLTSPAVRDALAPAPVLHKPFTRRELIEGVQALAVAR